MTEKHYPYCGGSFDRIIFDKDGSVWVPETENAKLREELADAPKCETCEAMLDCDECLRADGSHKERRRLSAENAKLRELLKDALIYLFAWIGYGKPEWIVEKARELGIEVDA